MTKAKMRQFLRYKMKQLDATMEPEKFYNRVEELFYKMRRIPQKPEQQESFDKKMDKWQEVFYGYAKALEFNHSMRKVSDNKKYQKPSLGPRFMKQCYPLLCIYITFSLLPAKETGEDL